MQKIIKVPVITEYPFEIKKELFTLPSKTLIIGISQSGASVSTYNAIEYAKAMGCHTLALIGEYNSYVGRKADYCFFTGHTK